MRLSSLLGTLACAASLCFGANELSGRRAPSFCLPDSKIQRYDILDYRGKWVLIDFMQTNCPHCQALSKNLEKVKAKYGDKVAVFSIVIAPPENQATVSKYIADQKVTSPILFDQGQMAASYFKMTPQNANFDTPHLFVIDPNGMIVRDFGWSEQNQTTLETDQLLKVLDGVMAKK